MIPLQVSHKAYAIMNCHSGRSQSRFEPCLVDVCSASGAHIAELSLLQCQLSGQMFVSSSSRPATACSKIDVVLWNLSAEASTAQPFARVSIVLNSHCFYTLLTHRYTLHETQRLSCELIECRALSSPHVPPSLAVPARAAPHSL